MLTVEKIGGTSMSRFQDVLNNIILGAAPGKRLYNRIFVVSAYAGVTNLLLEHKKKNLPGIYSLFARGEEYTKALQRLNKRLIKINENFKDIKLDLDKANDFINGRIKDACNYLESMSDVIASGYVDKNDILLAAREILASIGESHSAFNTVNILENNGIRSRFVDLSGFHDPTYMTIDERIESSLQGIDYSRWITVVTGYTKGSEGIMREFDRGYSEVTFSKIALMVKADEAVIHKEFHLSSADPGIVGSDKAIPVGQTNFDVADQLADVGMEAIHPKASKPIENAGINLRIKNTFEPLHPGTLISKKFRGHKGRVEIITGSDDVVAIELYDPNMVGDVNFYSEVVRAFREHGLNYILITNNANSISVVIWEHDKNRMLLKDLRRTFDRVTMHKVAIVCAIGSNIARPGVLSKATFALAEAGINVKCVAQTVRQVNMQFVINRQDYKTAICVLNEALCLG